MSDSLWPHGLYSPWTSPGQVTGVLLGSLDSGHSWRSVLYWLLHSCWVWAPCCGQRVSRCKMYREQVTKMHMWTLDISTCIEWKWTIQRQTMTEWEKPWTKYLPPAAAQSGLTLCDPMGYSPPRSSVHGIPQARILEWVAIFFSRGSSQPRDQTHVSCISCIGRQILYHCTTWEALYATHERQILNSKTQGGEIKRMEKDIPCKEKTKVARAAILILEV